MGKGVSTIEFSERQKKIIQMVKKNHPITSEQIAENLHLTRATLRADLALLTMVGILDARPKVGYFYSGNSIQTFIGDYIQKIKVKDVKSFPVIVSEETTIYDAIVTLFLEDVGTLFVQNRDKYLSGVVSRKDLLKIVVGNQDIHKIPVGMIMTRMPNIAFVYGEDSIYDAAVEIMKHEIDSVPVVESVKDKNGEEQYKITGRISKTNIAKVFVEIGRE